MKGMFTFLIGMLVGVIGLYIYSSLGSPQPVAVSASSAIAMTPTLALVPIAAVREPELSAIETAASKPATAPPLTPAATAVTTSDAAVPVENQLLIPVAGIHAGALKDTFNDARGSERGHEAIDILAPSGTQVFAVADGKVTKLFTSKPGGLTVYQFDTSEKFAYYYAHLDRYATDVKEGMTLKCGDLIGYVGSSGNADPKTPHLHFAIFALGPEKQWWEGTPINPFPLLGGTKRP